MEFDSINGSGQYHLNENIYIINILFITNIRLSTSISGKISECLSKGFY